MTLACFAESIVAKFLKNKLYVVKFFVK